MANYLEFVPVKFAVAQAADLPHYLRQRSGGGGGGEPAKLLAGATRVGMAPDAGALERLAAVIERRAPVFRGR